jgi:hypothetical protein
MNPIDQANAVIRMHQAQDELLERLAQGECFLDAIDDAARIARLSEEEKRELTEYGLSI